MTDIEALPGHEWIVTHPDLLGGQPAIRGTRLTVGHVLACLAEGMSGEEIATDYPGFPPESLPEVLPLRASRSVSFDPMLLLAQNLPHQLRELLKGYGYEAETAAYRGWSPPQRRTYPYGLRRWLPPHF